MKHKTKPEDKAIVINMTNALRIDTLAFARQLKDAGADERLAEAIVEGLAIADISHLSTRDDLKAEIAGLRSELTRFATREELKAELDRFATKDNLKAEIAGIRTEIAQIDAKIDKSSNRILLALVAVGGSIMVAVLRGGGL